MTDQEALPADGMPEPKTPHKVTFTGLKTTSLADVFSMDSRHKFEIEGVVMHNGPKRDAKGNLFRVVEIKVDSLTPTSYVEPKRISPVDRADVGEDA